MFVSRGGGVRTSAKLIGLAALACTLPSASSAAPQGNPVASRNFGASGIFLDTIDGNFVSERPSFVRKPDLAQFVAALGGRLPTDFGLSFSCAVQGSGRLTDCHTIFADPGSADGPALTRALAPLLTLEPADARLAVRKEYRLTVDAALQTVNSEAIPLQCLRPFCIPGDIPPPPPPPPQAKDPLVRERVKAANDCFSSNWDKSTNLRFAADKAVRENEQQPPPQKVRQAVLDYVQSRTELKKCMAMLQQTAHVGTTSEEDRKAVNSVLDWMEMNYSGQTRFEVAILIGFIDKETGERQLSFPGQWP